MTGRVVDVGEILTPDRKAVTITERYISMDMLRQLWKESKEEIRRYVYATDTTSTTNSSLPWKNKTTVPKLCQIRDNLQANYQATLWPNSKPITWIPNSEDAASPDKADAILTYMRWCTDQPSFKAEMDKVILDYIDYGNCFATVEWVDDRVKDDLKTTSGYVGPAIKRINPQDIVMNPTAESFQNSPKIVRSLISLGELKLLLERMSMDDNREEYEALWDYLREIRSTAVNFQGDLAERDRFYSIDGFTSFREYLASDYCEVLTFYGDLYDRDEDTLYRNHVITVVDRHKLIGCKPNPSYFGSAPIFHAPWRRKPDNLWGMGPLDNLIGMQYRMDHVENMKADIFDLVTFPVQKIKGFVEDYTWQPGEKIFVSEEGDVDMVVPDVQALAANFEIQNLERLMEEMAGAPREAMGIRTPGEKTAFEVQQLQNASARIFQNKIKQFEENIVEPLLNAMLELARRNMPDSLTVQVFNDEFKSATFATLTPEDITGVGRLKPMAARHFAEQAQLVQNLTSLASSPLWPTVQSHFSSVKLAELFENFFDLKEFKIVLPYVAVAEQAQAQKQAAALQEQVMQEMGTATGMGNDYDLDQGMQPPQQEQPL